ncbi:hypothetical protein BDV30DRAFT_216115 [Aspergillus minisclerotigenes]|uniref:Uncharacterized protein n=1 Tax=Aspergillus minisclerotigenes TaxID=656917 RepID=A0A5N6IX64_9EURO|nr:hypothetical protein BDV30DRAFT_216115 [Aspergillus minisclerotigenes]
MDPRWPHGGRSTSDQLRICLLLGIASCTPPHPSSFSASGPSLPPARACAFWVAPPAHAGHSSRSGLSCQCLFLPANPHYARLWSSLACFLPIHRHPVCSLF